MADSPSRSDRARAMQGESVLSEETIEAIASEARRRRRRPDALVREWLQDMQDGRAAQAARRRSAGKPGVSLSKLKAELGK